MINRIRLWLARVAAPAGYEVRQRPIGAALLEDEWMDNAERQDAERHPPQVSANQSDDNPQ